MAERAGATIAEVRSSYVPIDELTALRGTELILDAAKSVSSVH